MKYFFLVYEIEHYNNTLYIINLLHRCLVFKIDVDKKKKKISCLGLKSNIL